MTIYRMVCGSHQNVIEGSAGFWYTCRDCGADAAVLSDLMIRPCINRVDEHALIYDVAYDVARGEAIHRCARCDTRGFESWFNTHPCVRKSSASAPPTDSPIDNSVVDAPPADSSPSTGHAIGAVATLALTVTLTLNDVARLHRGENLTVSVSPLLTICINRKSS